MGNNNINIAILAHIISSLPSNSKDLLQTVHIANKILRNNCRTNIISHNDKKVIFLREKGVRIFIV